MDVTELEKKHVGLTAKVTYPDSVAGDSFTGVITNVSHGWIPSPRSSAIVEVGGQKMVIMEDVGLAQGAAVIEIVSS